MKIEIMVHLPFPYFNSDQLIRTFSANQKFFTRFGLYVPNPDSYRSKISTCLRDLECHNGMRPSDSYFEWSNLDRDRFRRIFISLPSIISSPDTLFDSSGLIPGLNLITDRLQRMFRGYKVTLLLGIVNQGNLIGTVSQAKGVHENVRLEEALCFENSWFDTIGACADMFPDVNINVWQHENAHLKWPKVIKHVANISNRSMVPGSLDMISHLVATSGLNALVDHVKRLPPQNDYHFEKVLQGYLERYPSKAWVARRVRLKGWNTRVMKAFEEIYREDIRLLRNEKQIAFID